ncbi:MAG: hypothetical protein Q9179_006532 [Wetmoreana sp. 5 TL-2023]
MVERGSEEERWCKERHLENNTFGDQVREEQGVFGAATRNPEVSGGDGGASCFIEGEEVRVMLVPIKEGRIADWKGGVKDWVIRPPVEQEERGRQVLVNVKNKALQQNVLQMNLTLVILQNLMIENDPSAKH